MINLETLNENQREAVCYTNGPLLILAGAGSGKTRVVTHRIAYLISRENVKPYNIMAITFTNKAAEEMKNRVNDIVGFGAEQILISTFHSACLRILRQHIDKIGYKNDFVIYDTDDSKSAIKLIIKKLELDKKLKEREIMSKISKAKNDMISADEYLKYNEDDLRGRQIAHAYMEYERMLKNNNALDFDDLLLKTVELFKREKEVLLNYQERFKYIHVDEYQDTNKVQFEFIKLLAAKYQNICVVGDDDQSIYKFRGADITNILNFENVFKNTKVIKLEQNYRSTKNILDAANEVIKNNQERKSKKLWTSKEEGESIEYKILDDEYKEASYIATEIARMTEDGSYNYRDIACLYRTNAQSRIIEEKLLLENIPYKIVGGQNFYQRKEIKDIIAYLKTVDNAYDDLAVRRIINVPKRGIGLTTISKIQSYADQGGISFFDACLDERLLLSLGERTSKKINAFTYMIRKIRAGKDEDKISDIFEKVITETGYESELKEEDTIEAQSRLENIGEFFNKAVDFEEKNEKGNLSDFLSDVALIADIDNVSEDDNKVLLMTIHSAKGLEFPKVFLCGMEDNLFPSKMILDMNDERELEEERRLCYVAITRAMQSITMTSARRRMLRGDIYLMKTSRFIREIPSIYEKASSASQSRKSYDYKNDFSGITTEKQRDAFKRKAFNPSDYKVEKLSALSYGIGDKVKHIKFGIGTVKDIKDGGRDFEVTVDFEGKGEKKMFASFAKLVKL